MPSKPTYATPVDHKAIGKRLREIRQRRGVTQVELAHQLGMRQALLSEYELGKLRLHGGLIVAFARALNVSADEILGIREPKRAADIDRGLAKRVHEISKLPKSNKKLLLRTIDAFLRSFKAA